MATLERTFTVDRDLARRADRKMRRYGSDLNGLLSIVVTIRGLPSALLQAPLPLDFTVDGVAMRKRRGVALPIEAEELDGMHTARAENIGLDAFAETRAELAGEVREQLAMLWKEYALADDAELTESAQRVKRNLLATFEEAR